MVLLRRFWFRNDLCKSTSIHENPVVTVLVNFTSWMLMSWASWAVRLVVALAVFCTLAAVRCRSPLSVACWSRIFCSSKNAASFSFCSCCTCRVRKRFPPNEGPGVGCGCIRPFPFITGGRNCVVVLCMTSSGLLSVEGAVIAGGGSRGVSVGGSLSSSCHPSKLKAESGQRKGVRAASSIASSTVGGGGRDRRLRWLMMVIVY